MNDMASEASVLPGDDAGRAARYYKREFWIEENRKHIPAHYRLRKLARIISKVAAGKTTDLLDVGCGPGTLRQLLPDNVSYYGIDIAIHDPAPNLREADIIETPIGFGSRRFQVVVAQGLFEYLGHAQASKFAEVASILTRRGVFIVTFTNFGHRRAHIYEPFNNIQSVSEFRASLARYFHIDKFVPISHNWYGGQPTRRLVKAANMYVSCNIPGLSPRLAVEYVFLCSRRRQ